MKKIQPRPFPEDTIDDVPKHWLAGKVLATHLANGVSVLFPAGERFFVRSVRHYLKLVEAHPELKAAVRDFSAQEGFHARAHDRQIELLEAQGYRIRPFLRVYEALAFGFLERVFPPTYRLATTAACEHFTSVMAENFLSQGFERTDPRMRRLLQWHACEEIEHRAVAFEVLKLADDRYSTRMAGLAIATATLSGFWIAAALYLVAQEPDAARTAMRELRELLEHQPFGSRVFGRGIKEYLRRDFHPLERTDLDELADRHLRSIGFDPAAASA